MADKTKFQFLVLVIRLDRVLNLDVSKFDVPLKEISCLFG